MALAVCLCLALVVHLRFLFNFMNYVLIVPLFTGLSRAPLRVFQGWHLRVSVAVLRRLVLRVVPIIVVKHLLLLSLIVLLRVFIKLLHYFMFLIRALAFLGWYLLEAG